MPGITVLADVILPNSVVSAGVRGKNMRLNSRVALNNGYQTINTVWSRTLRQFELGTNPMLPSAWRDLEAIFEITEGGAFGFLFEDPKDCQTSTGIVTDVSAGVYQLNTRYVDRGSSRFKNRVITRPKAGGFALYNLGVPEAYTLDEETGLVTVPAEPDAANLEWAGRFYIPVHFMEDSIDWDLIAPGAASQRLIAGPSVVLTEIRE